MLSVILGVVGTIGLILTLYCTRKAVLAAEDATRDAEDALTIARETADAAREANRISGLQWTDNKSNNEKIQRAYLVAEFNFDVESFVLSGETRISFYGTFENVGLTNALDVKINCQTTAIAPNPNPFEIEFPPMTLGNGGILARGKSIQTIKNGRKIETLNNLMKSHVVLFTVVAFYKTIFDEQQRINQQSFIISNRGNIAFTVDNIRELLQVEDAADRTIVH